MTDDYLGALKAAWTQRRGELPGPLRVVQGHLHRAAAAAAPAPADLGGRRERGRAAARRAPRRRLAPDPQPHRLLRDEGMPKLRQIADRRAARCPRSARASACA